MSAMVKNDASFAHYVDIIKQINSEEKGEINMSIMYEIHRHSLTTTNEIEETSDPLM